jgi:hypothetical protein
MAKVTQIFKQGDKVKIKKGTELYYQAPDLIGEITHIRNNRWVTVKFPQITDGYPVEDLELVEQESPATTDFIVEVQSEIDLEYLQKKAFEAGHKWTASGSNVIKLSTPTTIHFNGKGKIFTLAVMTTWPTYRFPEQAKEIFDLLKKEDEIKVGDYVYVVKPCFSSCNKIGEVLEVEEITSGGLMGFGNYTVYRLSGTGWRGEHRSGIRKATPEEIKEAKKPKFPDITINGYKGEFFDEYVKFGCAIINKHIFDVLFDIIELKPDNNNRTINEVTIGSGKFSAAQIKQIAGYYKAKENASGR